MSDLKVILSPITFDCTKCDISKKNQKARCSENITAYSGATKDKKRNLETKAARPAESLVSLYKATIKKEIKKTLLSGIFAGLLLNGSIFSGPVQEEFVAIMNGYTRIANKKADAEDILMYYNYILGLIRDWHNAPKKSQQRTDIFEEISTRGNIAKNNIRAFEKKAEITPETLVDKYKAATVEALYEKPL